MHLLADDGEDGGVVHFGVVEAVEEMDCAGAAGGEADADFAGEFGVGAGHEGGHFLVADLDEAWIIFGALESAHDSVDAIAGIAVDAVDAPAFESID